MPKRTDSEIRADLAAKIAKIDAREANKKAREASKDVRRLERDLSAARGFLDIYSDSTELRDIIVGIERDIAAARAAALKEAK